MAKVQFFASDFDVTIEQLVTTFSSDPSSSAGLSRTKGGKIKRKGPLIYIIYEDYPLGHPDNISQERPIEHSS